ncbi:MAG TPA: aminotransferase class III-fold pyridoxal phosphate-dependent enzyme [Candidatus Dormibacteraeota bacterium]|nr:aminotransferase class III-fold pyridoxal phosphate-dependent enzyme [Candidatus Dormibacteraeota bacterium]
MLLEARVTQPTTEAQAVRLARELYGLETSARALPGEYDDNFHLTSAAGHAFVLKVMHPAREHSFLDLQCRALTHLAQRAPHLPLPRVKANRSGELFTSMAAADGSGRLVWLLTFVIGTALAEVCPHTPELLGDLGRFLGEMDAALQSFTHAAAHRELKWDSSRAAWIRDFVKHIADARRRALVEKFLALYEAEVLPLLTRLRSSVIYGDANDHNVLVSNPWPPPRKVVGVIDFGDMHHGLTVSEPAIAAAYAMLGKEEPLPAAAAIVAGYHRAYPLDDLELRVLYALIGARLAVSVTNSAHRKTIKPDDPYVTVSEAPAWEALERLAKIHPRFAHYTFRAACGLPPVPQGEEIKRWLEVHAGSAASILDVDVGTAQSVVFDLSVGSTFLGADPCASDPAILSEKIFREMKRAGASVGVGRYDEPRLLYSSPLFGSAGNPTSERRTIHLGIDLFAEQGTTLHAPLDGVVHIVANNSSPLDYGPLVILRHETSGREEFFTLYGHLSKDALDSLKVGQRVARGQPFARVGSAQENGGWTPHLHFQIILDVLELGADFPGVAYASQRSVWTSLSPNPNLLLGIPADRFPAKEPGFLETLAARQARLGRNLSVSYQHPLKIVRGWMQYLYDETGRAYLDVYNNVPLVGHSHPRVVQAAQAQLALLNTNTRYLHDNVNRYAERLTELLPDPLRVCFFVNSGSEANELALRLARTHTAKEDVIVLEHAYHGHTSTLIDISPYKFNGPGGSGKKPWVHVAPLADDFRGRYRREDKQAGAKYARDVEEILERARAEGRGVAAYIAETLPSVGGQIVFPPDYLAEVYRHLRRADAVCIADEVQVGFGRLGTHFWGFETQGVVPDIVVLGKPIGNAFPLAAVVTTPEIANSFNNGMEFFSTFGGNPVACAAGLAVLDVLEEENLRQHALRLGAHLIEGLKSLQVRHALIGDIRGSGLFLGIDFVLDRETREPAPLQASYVVNRLRDCGILTGTDGPHHNVIKLRPPLVFSAADAELFVKSLDAILHEDAAQPCC